MSNEYPQVPDEPIDLAQNLATERQVMLDPGLTDAVALTSAVAQSAQQLEVEQGIGQLQPYAEQLNEARLSEILSRVPDVAPLPGDERL
jgi:hypothetical protein